MGEIVGAGLLAHVPTIVLPDDERRALNNGNESTLYTGLHNLRRDVFDVLKPDLVIVFDSHWFTTVEFVITGATRRLGYFTSEELPRGMSSVPYDAEGDPAFANLSAPLPTRHLSAGSRRSTMITFPSSTPPRTFFPSFKATRPGSR